MRNKVAKVFDECINSLPKLSDEAKRFFTGHERKFVCIDKLCKEIENIERQTYSINFDTELYRELIGCMVAHFVAASAKHLDESLVTHAEKQRRITAHNRIDQIGLEFEADQKEAVSDVITNYPTIN